MKNILLTTLISLLVGCQTNNIKKSVEIDANNKYEKTNTELAGFLEAINVMEDLDKCYGQEKCKDEIYQQLNDWLIEKEILSLTEDIHTDEEVKQLPKITEKNNSSNNIVLSSHYMNNQLVKGAINEWLTWKRPQLIKTWQYYQFLKQDMKPAFDRYHIEEAFVLAIMSQESGGKVHSRSRAGAGGLFQLMPATARRLGLSGKIGAYDLRFNPKASASAAAKYISEQSNLYQGDEAKILAAYNSGENRFRYLNKKYKNRPIWDKDFYYRLPRETRHYIPVVIGAMLIFQNPEKFNLKLDTINNETISVSLANKTSLSEIAICLGQEQRDEGWFRVLRNLNSGIKADTTIQANTPLKIPKILLETFDENCHNQDLMSLAKSFHNADFKEIQGVFKYRVQKGDSLGKIAKKFKCTSSSEIASLNQLKAPRYLIRAGKYLKIPQCQG